MTPEAPYVVRWPLALAARHPAGHGGAAARHGVRRGAEVRTQMLVHPAPHSRPDAPLIGHSPDGAARTVRTTTAAPDTGAARRPVDDRRRQQGRGVVRV
ncbi:hypothetical protein ABZ348_26735 [Streptomyces sp. NPDC005963]|uniref:hypothetical protein n=1 Tax=Streptomyces sp. NPDC005963 TaxID=3156721 RepID=UPI0033C5A6F1